MVVKMILGKRHIILGALVVALAGAVYLNYVFASNGSELDAVDTTKNLGDAKLVNQTSSAQPAPAADGDYFVNARLTREQTRAKALEIVNETLKDAKLTQEDKDNALAQLTAIAKFVELEGKVENLIKAKGFTDCIVILEGNTADVVVKSAGLKANESMQIKDIVINTAKVPAEKIKITEIK